MVIAGAMIVASLLPVAWLAAQPRGTAEVAAIFPPWASHERAIVAVAAAGGLVVRRGAFDAILVVHGQDAHFVNRLYAAGAWAVIDPTAFGGCLAGVRGEN
jgi:hypothetical protein